MKRFVIFCICLFVMSCASGTASLAGFCSGSVLHVPHDCATVQQAVDAAERGRQDQSAGPLTTVLLEQGTYHESVKVPARVNLMILPSGSGEVVIDGGSGSAIRATEYGTRLFIGDMTLRSQQQPRDVLTATVFMELGYSLVLDGVKVITSTHGVVANYTAQAVVENSYIVGNGSAGSSGLRFYNIGSAPNSTPSEFVYSNHFEDLEAGIFRCSLYGSLRLGPPDRNTYERVLHPLIQQLPDPCEGAEL